MSRFLVRVLLTPSCFRDLQTLILGLEVHDDRAGALGDATSVSAGAERSFASGALSSTQAEGRYVWLLETEAGEGADAHSHPAPPTALAQRDAVARDTPARPSRSGFGFGRARTP